MKDQNVVQLHAIDDPLHELMTEFDFAQEEEFGVKVEVKRQERMAQMKVDTLEEAVERMKFYLDEIEMVLP